MMRIDKLYARMGMYLLQARPRPCVYFYRMTCLWGLFLLLPFQTFDAFSSFAVMRQLAPEEVWGVLLFVAGYRLKLAAVSKRTKNIRDALFGVMIYWIFITIMLIKAAPTGTGVIVYPLFTYYVIREYLIYSTRYTVLKQETEEASASYTA